MMKRSTNSRAPASELPSFLDPTSGSEDGVAELAADVGEETEQHDGDHDGDDEGSAKHSSADEDPNGWDSEEEAAAAGDESTEPGDEWRHPKRSRRRAARTANGPASGGFAMAVGLLLTITAVVVACVPAATARFAAAGVEPQIALLVGISLFAIGAGQRRVARVDQRIEELAEQRAAADDELRDVLAELNNGRAGHSSAIEAGGDLQGVLLSLQRQDQKINNLTKAIKMYGKPLMEIAGQGTELAGNIAQVKTLIEGGAESTRQAVNRLENQFRKGAGQADLGELPAQISRLEVSLAAVTQRLEDSEVRKSLVRLEDVSKELRADLQQLQRGDNIRAATGELQQRLDKATQGLAAGIEQLRNGNLGGLESSVREIQREVAGLATSVAQIQVAVKSGVGVASAAGQAPTTTGPRPPAASTSPSAPGSAPPADGYQTGQRSSAGNNVLGAIAKLKQMKS